MASAVAGPNDQVLERTVRIQLRRFEESDARCRGVQLPDALLLRFDRAEALFFRLRSGVTDGRLVSRVFASDSPYHPEQAFIGEVLTPLLAGRRREAPAGGRGVGPQGVVFVGVDPD